MSATYGNAARRMIAGSVLIALLVLSAGTATAQLITDPGEMMAPGALELESRFLRGFRSHEFNTRNELSTWVRFGLIERLEFRLDASHYVSQRTEEIPGRRSGVGDTSPGIAYQVLRSDDWPALALAYEITLPTASRRKGLGSGRIDHTLSLLASDTIGDVEWEFNYFLGWIGREGRSGFDNSHLFALSFQRKILGPLGIVGEIYGAPRLNRETPGFASTDWTLTYALTPQVQLEAGVDVGLTRAAPDITYFTAIKIVLADLYRFARGG